MRSQRPFLDPGTVVADYEVLSIIGRGGMGVVYLARDVRLDRRVALKLLAPEYTANAGFRARFLRESRVAAAVDHPNIIPIYEAGNADGQLFIAMRYVPGVDLRREMDERGRLDLPEALDLLEQWWPTPSTPPMPPASSTGTSNPATSCSPSGPLTVTGRSTSPTSG